MHRRNFMTISFCLLSMEWGCSSQTGRSKAEVASRLKEILKLKEIRLTEAGQGKYEGTGTTADGTMLKITATQGNNELRWEFEDSKGGKGNGY